MSKERELAESLPQKFFQNYDGVISERIAQLDVNKPFKQTKTDLRPILSLSFDSKDLCIEYSVVLSAKLDKVINSFALPLKKKIGLCFPTQGTQLIVAGNFEPSKTI